MAVEFLDDDAFVKAYQTRRSEGHEARPRRGRARRRSAARARPRRRARRPDRRRERPRRHHHGRLLRPGAQAALGARDRSHRRRRARHPGPRAHPRPAGPALRPERARRHRRDLGRGLRVRPRSSKATRPASRTTTSSRCPRPTRTRTSPKTPTSRRSTTDRALRHPTRARPLHERAVHLRAPVHRVPPRRRRHGSGRPRLRRPTPYRGGDHRPGGGPSRRAGRAGRDAEAAAGRAPPRRRPTTSARSSLYLVLASRVDPQVALRAAEGWGGDAATSASRSGAADDQQCVRVAIAGDTDVDTAEMADALAQWTAALAGRRGDVGAGRRPGARSPRATPGPRPHPARTCSTPRSRCSSIATTSRSSSSARTLPPRVTRCAADRLVADPAFGRAPRAETKFTDAQQDQFSDRSRARCRPAEPVNDSAPGAEPPAPSVVSIVEVVD